MDWTLVSAVSTAVSAITTVILTCITFAYVYATFRITKANERVVDVMREQVRASSRPYIVVSPSVELETQVLSLRITNQGKTAAINLRLAMDKSFFQFGNKEIDISKFSAFSQTIDSFQPGSALNFFLAQGFEIFADGGDLPHTFSVTAEYEFEGERVREINIIDLRPYQDLSVMQNAYFVALKDIQKSLEKISCKY